MKVLTVVGTRPELIRLSRVIPALDAAVDHRLVHTGQNFDFELNDIFFRDLSLRSPDYSFGIGRKSLGEMLGTILIEMESVLNRERPDAVLILGDTNSSIAAIMAKRMQVPIYHMEAGNRSFDANVPEEVNRRIIDRISDFNLVYTEHARRHLLSEGAPHRRVYLTGSPMREVLEYYADRIEASSILEDLGLEPRRYFVASMHREENVDSVRSLELLVGALNEIVSKYELPVIVSTHPRTQQRLAQLTSASVDPRIVFSKPFGFHDYNKLQKNALCVLSDSGTISEESAILEFPAVTVRRSMERPEALDTGSIVLTGLDTEIVLGSVGLVVEQYEQGAIPPCPADYMVRNVSQRVVNLIMGTARLSHFWDSVVVHEHRWKGPEDRGRS